MANLCRWRLHVQSVISSYQTPEKQFHKQNITEGKTKRDEALN
jgi:hypothetical protein